MAENPSKKTCFCCKQKQSVSFFFKSSNTSDGLHSWCKACCKAGNDRARDKVNASIEGRAKIFLRNAKNSAQKRNQEFRLSVQDIQDCWRKQKQVCAYSGRLMTLKAGELNTVSIERIDSSQGYIPDNVILVCQAINRMKSNFAFEDFYDLCRDVAEFLGDDELKLSVGAYK
jgi:hypothetical protein